MIELLLGQIPEAIYFAVFMILVKNFKEKKVLFTMCLVFQYLLLCNIFPYDIKFQFFFIFTSYFIMKIMYKDKVQITDIFLFLYATFILIIVNVIMFISCYYFGLNYYIANVISKIFMFGYIILRRKNVGSWYRKYYLNWNRKKNSKIRSLDIRNGSLMFMYFIIVVLDIGFMFSILVGR